MSVALAGPRDPDTAFGAGGAVLTALGDGNAAAEGLARQPDGRLVVAGEATQGGVQKVALARYMYDGSLDGSFSGDGALLQVVGDGDSGAESIALQPDGKIVVAGHAVLSGGRLGGPSIFVARFMPDGTPDGSFGAGGARVTRLGGDLVRAGGVAVQSDGKIVVAGYVGGGTAVREPFVARYTAGGTLDTAGYAAPDGVSRPVIGGDSFALAEDLLLQPLDGRAVIAGTALNAGVSNLFLARLKTDGTLDASFDGDGILLDRFGASPLPSQVFGLAERGGSLWVTGSAENSGAKLAVGHYGSDGSGGIDSIGAAGTGRAVAVQQNTVKVYLAGSAPNAGQTKSLFTRVEHNFVGDTFGAPVLSSIGDGGDAVANDIVLQPDDGVVVAGRARDGGRYKFMLARYGGTNKAPNVAIQASPNPAKTNEDVQFFNSSSDDDGSVVRREWDLDGDGTFELDNPCCTPGRQYGQPGTYTVRLRATDNLGARTTRELTVTVENRPPIALFNHTADGNTTSGTPIHFVSHSQDQDGSITKTEWDFEGDGTYDAQGSQVSHTYPKPGTYNPTVRATDDRGAVSTATKTFTLANTPPLPKIAGQGLTHYPVNSTLTFDGKGSQDPDGQIVKYEWRVGDTGAFTSTGATPTFKHKFTKKGSHLVTLRVTDDLGATQVDGDFVTIVDGQKPVAKWTYSPPVKAGVKATFDASKSVDSDGKVVKYEWRFGSGDWKKGSKKQAHTFSDGGKQKVSLRVTDDTKLVSAVSSADIGVVHKKPTASFTYKPEKPYVGQTVEFNGTASKAGTTGIKSYHFDFGDGHIEKGSTLKYAYQKAGTYKAKLIVTGQDGQTGTTTKTIVVKANGKPTAKFGVSPSEPQIGDGVTFDIFKSSDPEGKMKKFDFVVLDKLRGGGPLTLTNKPWDSPKPFVAIQKDGLYEAELAVYDDVNQFDDEKKTFVVADAKCYESAPFGSQQATAPCFKKVYAKDTFQQGNVEVRRLGSTGPVRLNGVDFVPADGSRIVIEQVYKGGTKPQGNPRLYTETVGGTAGASSGSGELSKSAAPGTGSASIEAGEVTLQEGKLDWSVPGGTKFPEFQIEPGASLKGFSVNPGTTKIDVTGPGQASITANIVLPPTFGGLTGEVKLILDAGGLRLDKLHVEANNVPLGPVIVKHFGVDYDDALKKWEGSLDVILPTPQPLNVLGNLIFIDGQFNYGKVQAGSPTVPLNWAVGSGAFLQSIAVEIQVDPLKLGGQIVLTAGPTVAGQAGVRIDAGVTWTLPDADPWVLRVDGVLFLVGVQMADSFVEVHGDGFVNFGGSFYYNWGPVELNAGVGGFFTTSSFNVEGHGSGCIKVSVFGKKFKPCIELDAVLSSVGVAACGKVKVFGWRPSVGFGYRWDPPDLDLMAPGCDIGPYKAAPASTGLRLSGASTSETVTLAPGLDGAVLEVTGEGGPPMLALTGPNGEHVEQGQDGIVETKDFYILPVDDETNRTFVALNAPAAGQWKLESLLGSPEIKSVAVAETLPRPKITVKPKPVLKKSQESTRAKEFSYDIAPAAGQTVSFVERGTGAFQDLGRMKGGKGTLRFTPADGPAGKRTIVALVSQNGLPRENIEVATFTARGPVRPGKPRGLKAARRSGGLRVSWANVPGAARYEVRVRVSDGRRLLFPATAKRRTAQVPGVGASETATVSVRAVTAGHRAGAPASVKVGPVKTKRKR